jgi:hypothetical protein
MFRTTPPPEGIFSWLKVWDLGSKRTSVLGLTPDSLYQTVPSLVNEVGIEDGVERFCHADGTVVEWCCGLLLAGHAARRS